MTPTITNAATRKRMMAMMRSIASTTIGRLNAKKMTKAMIPTPTKRRPNASLARALNSNTYPDASRVVLGEEGGERIGKLAEGHRLQYDAAWPSQCGDEQTFTTE